MSKIKQIVLVGHCGFDSQMLSKFASSASGGIPICSCKSEAQLNEYKNEESLLLINRVLDGDFESTRGVELIKKLAEAPCPPKMILISNYEDAQQLAEANGAMPGFGKSDLHNDFACDCIEKAIA